MVNSKQMAQTEGTGAAAQYPDLGWVEWSRELLAADRAERLQEMEAAREEADQARAQADSLPKLFISFHKTMLSLALGLVTIKDLETGLFAFSCFKDHAIEPGKHGEGIEDVVVDHPDLHTLLVEALGTAEVDGRIRWRELDGTMSFQIVNELLADNGFMPLSTEGADSSDEDNYSYEEVARGSRQLEVVWRLF